MSLSHEYHGDGFNKALTLVEPISKSPRYYQANAANKAVDNIIDGIASGNTMRQDIVSPTGTGKTLISKLVALNTRLHRALGVPEGKPIRVLYLSHRRFILDQAVREYRENKLVKIIPHSTSSAIPENILSKGWHLTICDESHHESTMSFQRLLESIGPRPLVGLTADNSRHDRLMLKFERSIYAISVSDAAEMGFIEKVGVNSITDVGGTDKSDLVVSLLSRYHRHMGNTLVFMRTEKELRKTYRAMKQIGVTCDILTSADSDEVLAKKVDALSRGKIQFLLNCKKLGEGMDTPAVTDVVLARRFESEQEKKQYVGRGIRCDSPCAVWEIIDPTGKNVMTRDLVGATKYERFIYQKQGEWNEVMISGEDPTWGAMSDLRMIYSNQYNERMPEDEWIATRSDMKKQCRDDRIVSRNLSSKKVDFSRMMDQLLQSRLDSRRQIA